MANKILKRFIEANAITMPYSFIKARQEHRKYVIRQFTAVYDFKLHNGLIDLEGEAEA